MTNPSISVVVPMYKVERYIKLCVDSILAQTFQDFEIILVDDASPDNCAELCRKLYGDNDKVKLVRHEKNLGLGPARNTGIKHSRGKYIHFVDSDDYILPDALEKFFNAAEKNNADVVHACGRYEFTQDEPEPVPQENLRLFWDKYNVEGFLDGNLPARMSNNWRSLYPTAWLYFCRRDFLENRGIEFLPIISEDEPFHFALVCFAEKYYILHEALYVYRKRNDSIMGTKDANRLERVVHAMLLSSNYVASILDLIPHFEGYEQWREDILGKFLEKFFGGHTRHYYEDPNSDFETNLLVKKIFTPLFGNAEAFVQFFFNEYHKMRRQIKSAKQKEKTLRQENRYLKNFAAAFIAEQPALLELMTKLKSDTKKIFLLGTPRHGNLGDHAIVLGEIKILREYFPEHEIVEILRDYFFDVLGEMFFGLGAEKYIRDGDVICYTGGGNLGNLWLDDENARRLVIANFPQNKIVVFPQSICFTDDDDGRRELKISQQIYNAHEDLHLMTRDENSFAAAKKFFPRIGNYLLPDAATVLRGITDDIEDERDGVLFILRRDKEKVRNDNNIRYLQNYFAEKNIPFDVTDTVLDERITADNREQKVFDMLAKIRRSKLVVTDRFHGVIFSFVTRTPVIAFKSFDTKISSGIKWFANFPSIFYAERHDWASVENFIRENYFVAAANPAALTVKVETDSRERFFRALDTIVAANKIYRVETNTPPRLPATVDGGVKKVFTLHVPLSICNFRCHYCYLSQRAESYQGIQPQMKYSPEQVARALSPKRLGGRAFFNICADGETMLLKNLDAYVKRLVEDGHFAEIVTNCTATPMLEKILSWDRKLLAQVEFKCSFHYLELKKKNLLNLFAQNVNKIWDAGASACVEVTPSDELIPYIDELKKFSLKNFGALPQVTIARDDRTAGIEILSKLPADEYYRTWRQFDSPFFDYKSTIFGKRQEEFCYAGLWSAIINLATGQAKACYCGSLLGDVFANPDEKFPTRPVGKCLIAHCYNAHAWLTWGLIPHATNHTYAEMRNRIRSDGREWLQPKLKNFFATHLCDNNSELSDAEKLHFMIKNGLGV